MRPWTVETDFYRHRLMLRILPAVGRRLSSYGLRWSSAVLFNDQLRSDARLATTHSMFEFFSRADGAVATVAR